MDNQVGPSLGTALTDMPKRLGHPELTVKVGVLQPSACKKVTLHWYAPLSSSRFVFLLYQHTVWTAFTWGARLGFVLLHSLVHLGQIYL